jgi:hypothetical protein
MESNDSCTFYSTFTQNSSMNAETKLTPFILNSQLESDCIYFTREFGWIRAISCQSTYLYVRFQVFTAVTMKNVVFCLQPPAQPGSSLADFSTLKMEAIHSSETSVQFTRSTRHHIPEDGILHLHIVQFLVNRKEFKFTYPCTYSYYKYFPISHLRLWL